MEDDECTCDSCLEYEAVKFGESYEDRVAHLTRIAQIYKQRWDKASADLAHAEAGREENYNMYTRVLGSYSEAVEENELLRMAISGYKKKVGDLTNRVWDLEWQTGERKAAMDADPNG